MMKPYYETDNGKLYHGDCLLILRELESDTVQCVVTSPPYWGLRDYGVEGQLGLEKTPEEYIQKMVEIFREIRRVLRPDGTLFLNMGDTYAGDIKTNSLKATEASWLAALIDGEGCIQIHRQKTKTADAFQLDISVGMIDKEMCLRTYQITGIGSFRQLNRGIWDWSVRGQQASILLKIIYPWLVLKKRQAAIGIELCRHLQDCNFNKGNPVTDEAIKYRQDLKEACSSCNQRKDNGYEIPVPQVIPTKEIDLKPKDLCGIPWRLALALQADGWYLRCDIIWSKPNPMPESVTDRPTKSHEYVFLMSKNAKYYYDAEAIKETSITGDPRRPYAPGQVDGRGNGHDRGGGNPRKTITTSRNRRSVWTIATQPFPEAHFACVDEKTECLTVNGWKTVHELTNRDQLACYDLQSKRAAWSPLLDLYKKQVQDLEMIKILGRGIDQLLTRDHRCVIKTRARNENKIIEAANLKSCQRCLVVPETWETKKIDFPIRLARLIGWYLTEGSEGKDTVTLYQSSSANPEYCSEIEQLLLDEGAEFTKYIRHRKWLDKKYSLTTWRITGAVANVLLSLCPNKGFPHDFLQWENEALWALWDTMMKGDGNFREGGRQTFVQKDKKIIDNMQALAVRLGYATTIRKRSAFTWALYKTNSKTRWLHKATGSLINTQQYTGMIWCPRTEKGTWIARRNGRVFITGNTFPEKLVIPCIMAGTKKGDIAFDPFVGSGTVGAVCEKYGRHWIGIELSKEYCDIAVERIKREVSQLKMEMP